MLRGAERGAVDTVSGDLRVCLVFPERYEIGMSNLGFHQVYSLMTAHPAVACERGFREPSFGAGSFETGRQLGRFDVLAFALPFELNYIGMLAMLDESGIPLRAAQRDGSHPFIVAGGVAVSANPEPVSELVDAVVAGDAEPVIETMLDTLAGHKRGERDRLLDALASVPGVYVPSRHKPEYDGCGRLSGYRRLGGTPLCTRAVVSADHDSVPARSAILTRHTEFGGAFLVELSRGCPRRCRFCMASALAPCRFFSADRIRDAVPEPERAHKVGLVGASISDHPDLEVIVSDLVDSGHSVTVSSLRHDRASDALLATLARGGQKTVTFAPETGSPELAQRIGKDLDESAVEDATVRAVTAGLRNVKLYFMIGLPGETDRDIAALNDLVRRAANRMGAMQREGKRVGSLRVTVSFFVPKPLTPFEDTAVLSANILRSRMRRLTSELRRHPLVTVRGPSLRWLYVQAVLSRGDRRAAELLESIVRDHMSPSVAVRRWAETNPAPAIEGFVEPALRPWDVLERPRHAATRGLRKTMNTQQEVGQ